jgi:hypothetical protein
LGEVANFVVAVFESDCGGIGAGAIDAFEQVGTIVTVFVPDVVVISGEEVAIAIVGVVVGAVDLVCAVGEIASAVVLGGGDAVEGIDGDLLPSCVEVAVAGGLTVCVCGCEDAIDGVIC